MPPKRVEVEIDGRVLSLSNLDKVLYPKAGFTKGQVIDYYTRIAPVLLAHLRDRPLTLKRYPNGVEGQYFYEKQCPKHRPDWVRTSPVYSRHAHRTIDFCVVDDLPTLVWTSNLADLELHTSLSRVDDVTAPAILAFDLDPGPPATIVECAEVAMRLRDLFERLGLECFPKTSGSKGMQVYVPLNVPTSYEVTKPFANGIAQLLERLHPELVVSDMKKVLRTGKVLVDWSQNDEHKTTVCVYSLRARDFPTVSTPITWDEVEDVLRSRDPDDLVFDSAAVLERVARAGDLFAAVETLEQELPSSL
jgi:bifunctional non-homologous end joining protein LigD